MYLSLSLSFSLSIHICIYVYTYITHIDICIYLYICANNNHLFDRTSTPSGGAEDAHDVASFEHQATTENEETTTTTREHMNTHMFKL